MKKYWFTKSLFLLVAFFVLGSFSLSMITARTAQAAALTPQQAATTCYGGAVSFHIPAGIDETDLGPYYTTSRCNDINLRFSNLPQNVIIHVCWTNHGYCNGGTSIAWYDQDANSWHVIASDVLDYTKFTVNIESEVGPFSDTWGYLAF